MTDDYDNELEELLMQAEKVKANPVLTPRDLVPKSIYITEGAYTKASKIGPLIKKLTDSDYEWSALLLADKGDSEYTIRDLLIQKGQDIRKGNVEISGTEIAQANFQVQKTNQELNLSRYIIGWIHGHGLAYNRPSMTDRENFSVVLNSTSLNTEQTLKSPLNLIETEVIKILSPDKLTFSGKAMEDATIEYTLKSDSAILQKILKLSKVLGYGEDHNTTSLLDLIISQNDIKFYEPNIFGFSYFMIMNNRNEAPYTGMQYESRKAITRGKKAEIIENLPLIKVQFDQDIIITDESLEKEIKDNIDLPKKWYGYNWDKYTSVVKSDTLESDASSHSNFLEKNKLKKRNKKNIYTNRSENTESQPDDYKEYTGGYKYYKSSSIWIPTELISSIDTLVEEYKKDNSAAASSARISYLSEFIVTLKKASERYNRTEQMDIFEDYIRADEPEEDDFENKKNDSITSTNTRSLDLKDKEKEEKLDVTIGMYLPTKDEDKK